MNEPIEDSLDDLLDRIVGEYADALAAGAPKDPRELLARVPAPARPGLERCLRTIDAGNARTPVAFQPLGPGTTLGRYRLVRELGRGGMAVVWLANDPELRRAVALKVLRPGLALETKHVDRFRREALAIASLKHPNVVQIYDVGEASGHHYLAMELVDGPSFATVLAALEGAKRASSEELALAVGVPSLAVPGQSFEQALCALFTPVVGALSAAHAIGLVHRDVKPSNILLRSDGSPVVADFGLAKGQGDPGLSLTGDPIGTPYYMSPEQAWLTDVSVDHRTDVYSLGVTLYEALSGRRPYEGTNVLEVFEAIKTHLAPGLRGVAPRASKAVAAIVHKAMGRRPEERYASAADLEADLQALVEGRPPQAVRDAGGFLRRVWLRLRLATAGVPFEYRSARTFLGWPLVHIVGGRRYPGQRMRVAKGWFAMGDVAVGGLAIGGFSAGLLSFGGISAGLLFGWGGIASGLIAFGGIAVGGFPVGGLAAGYLAMGGCALGYGALGGYANGIYAGGGEAHGTHILGAEDGVAEAWFGEALPQWLLDYFARGH